MADEHETESKAWAIEAAAAEAASRAAEEMHRPPVVPMERVVDRTDIERGERAGQKRSQEPGFPRFFAELNLGLVLTAFAIVAFKTPNHFAFGGTSGVSVILSTLFPTLPVGVFMWIINAVLVVLGFIFGSVRPGLTFRPVIFLRLHNGRPLSNLNPARGDAPETGRVARLALPFHADLPANSPSPRRAPAS